MNYLKPPNAEKLYPLLKLYLEHRYHLPFEENFKPFKTKTETLLENYPKTIGTLFVERYLLENYQRNFYSKSLLQKLLKFQAIPGYIIKFKKKPPSKYVFFRLDNIYFYPLFFGETKDLFIHLWSNKKNFCALYIELKKEENNEQLKDLLKLADKFHFTRISPKAKEEIYDLFELYSKYSVNLWEKLLKKSSLLLITTYKEGHLETHLKPKFSFYGKRFKFYLYEAKDLEIIKTRLNSGSATLGIISSELLRDPIFFKINPFLLGIATLEHAKRANKPFHILDKFTLHVLADLFYEWEDLGSALTFYELAKPYTLQPIELTLSVASVYYLLGNLEKAENTLKSKLCGCLKEDPRIHYNLGIIYQQKGDEERAEYHLFKAYLLDRENALFRKRLLDFLWEKERFEDIDNILHNVKEKTLDDKIFLGKIAFLNKRYKEALDWLQEINSYADRDGTALFFLAWLYLYFKKEKEAAELFLKEAKEKLSQEELNKLIHSFGLPQ
ncbi:MAG: tetratricopeptide repeat protein [Caldimicrobium sp.]